MCKKLTDSRRQRLIQVAKERTNHIRLALQDIHDPHNVAACYRSAEAMGIQHVDIINLYQKFTKPSTVAKGSEKWLSISRFTSISDYVETLRNQGYLLAAGFPSSHETLALEDICLNRPIAILFGNEHQGVDEGWQEHIDIRFTIPMFGMVESFNISVSAALSLYSLSSKARRELGTSYTLNEEEQTALLNSWALKHSRNGDVELRKLIEKEQN